MEYDVIFSYLILPILLDPASKTYLKKPLQYFWLVSKKTILWKSCKTSMGE